MIWQILAILFLVLWVASVVIISKLRSEQNLVEQLYKERMNSVKKDVKWFQTALMQGKALNDNLHRFIRDRADQLVRCMSITIFPEDEEGEDDEIIIDHLTVSECNAIKEALEHTGVKFQDDMEEDIEDIDDQIRQLIIDSGMKNPEEQN